MAAFLIFDRVFTDPEDFLKLAYFMYFCHQIISTSKGVF